MVNFHVPMVKIPFSYICFPKAQSVDCFCFSILMLTFVEIWCFAQLRPLDAFGLYLSSAAQRFGSGLGRSITRLDSFLCRDVSGISQIWWLTTVMNNSFLPDSTKILSTFQTFCPVGVQFAQTIFHFAHFQVQARKRGGLASDWGYYVYIHIPARGVWWLIKE